MEQTNTLLHKANTGIASEFLVAGELARRGYNGTITLGNTKSIDLIVEKNGKLIPVQVKGIQRKKSLCWNISLKRLSNKDILYVLVNLNSDTLVSPEYFVLTAEEVKLYFKSTLSGRDYLDYLPAGKLPLQNRWDKFEST